MIAVIKTNREPLILRSDPSLKSVRGFVAEHHRRFMEGRPGGPSGLPARQILAAHYYESTKDYLASRNPTPIDISDLIGS